LINAFNRQRFILFSFRLFLSYTFLFPPIFGTRSVLISVSGPHIASISHTLFQAAKDFITFVLNWGIFWPTCGLFPEDKLPENQIQKPNLHPIPYLSFGPDGPLLIENLCTIKSNWIQLVRTEWR